MPMRADLVAARIRRLVRALIDQGFSPQQAHEFVLSMIRGMEAK